MKFNNYLSLRVKRINGKLEKLLPKKLDTAQNLSQAMRYAVLTGGKRLRPILVYAVGETFGATLAKLDAAAAAIELIHASSLVHDDLPAMDNDTLRRGMPTCHIAFDEATAILVGYALITLAFELLPSTTLVKELAFAAGPEGMILGQDIDIHLAKNCITVAKLEKMHQLKTGALIKAAVTMGALCAGINDKKTLGLLHNFASNLGLAFQIQDDIFDALDKPKQKEINYASLIGIDKAKKKVAKLWQSANHALEQLDVNTDLLQSLLNHIMQREF
ncbi:MAG: polyprenyl synthetase family protein [Gammaproteobacteria bacterium]|nr:polyprenyl synthetase family protein [Gammaproteobacteria bacterium]